MTGIMDNVAPEVQTISISPGKKALITSSKRDSTLSSSSSFSFSSLSQMQDQTSAAGADVVHVSYTAAVGTRDGRLQVMDLENAVILRDLAVMEIPIRGIRWIDVNSLVCFGFTDNGAGQYRNVVRLVNMLTGDFTDFKMQETGSFIKDVKISHQKQYMLVIWNEKPLELWDLSNNTLTRQGVPYLNITTAEWSPLYVNKKREGAANLAARYTERFMLSLADGSLVNCTVTAGLIVEESKFPHRGGMNILTAMAWEKKENLLVAGDSGGAIHFYFFKAQKTRSVPTSYGEVRKIKFNHTKVLTKYLVVLFAEGAGVWDAENSDPVSFVPVTNSREPDRDMRILDVDWVGPESLVLAMGDGSLRVTDLTLRNFRESLFAYPRVEKLPSPHILPPKILLTFKTLLQHQPWAPKYSLSPTGDFQGLDPGMVPAVAEQLDLLPPKLIKAASNANFVSTEDLRRQDTLIPSITAHRCLLTAEFLGDRAEIDFWRMVIYYINHRDPGAEGDEGPPADPAEIFVPGEFPRRSGHGQQPPHTRSRASSTVSHTPSLDVTIGDGGDLHGAPAPTTLPADDDENRSTLIPQETASQKLPDTVKSLPRYFDILCDQPVVRARQLELCNLHETLSTTYEQAQESVQQHVFLGQHERAIQLLLETPSNTTNFKADALKACLVAALKSPEALRNTIKLVATNFIANNELFEGVQLLSLIGSGMEGCTYLQTYGHWNTAAILAKATLKKRERDIILRRWADNLQKNGELEKAIMVYVSLRDFHEVLQSFLGFGFYDLAALFLEVCEEQELPEVKNGSLRTISFTIWKSYSKYLGDLGMTRAAAYYEERAEQIHQQLQEEHQRQFGDRQQQPGFSS